MCPDPTGKKKSKNLYFHWFNFKIFFFDFKIGRRISKKLWKGCEMKKVSYEEYEEAFLEKTRLNLKLIRYEMIFFWLKIFKFCFFLLYQSHIHLKCLCAIICDPFDDTITLERFCNCVNWYEVFQKNLKVSSFFLKNKPITGLVQCILWKSFWNVFAICYRKNGILKQCFCFDFFFKKYYIFDVFLKTKNRFHGFVNSNKAAQLLKTRWSSTKQQVNYKSISIPVEMN